MDDEGFVCLECEARGVVNDDPDSDFCPGCGRHFEEVDE